MKNKTILILVALFVLFSLEVFSANQVVFKWQGSNTSLQEYQNQNDSATTSWYDPRYNVTTMAPQFNCRYAGGTSLPSCGTTSGVTIVSSLSLFGDNAMNFGGADPATFTYTAVAGQNLTMIAILGTSPLTDLNIENRQDGATISTLRISEAGTFLKFVNSAGTGVSSTLVQRISNDSFIWAGISSRTSNGLQFYSNGSTYDQDSSHVSILNSQDVRITAPNSVPKFAFRLWVLNETSQANSIKFNTSATNWQGKNINLTSKGKDFNLSYYGSKKEISNITLKIGCNTTTGIQWVNTTTNGTVVSCSQSVSTIIPFYGVYNSSSNVSAFFIINVTAPVSASDTTRPIVNTTFNITTPRNIDIINFTGNVTDETGLSTANITINFSTGLVKINFTLAGTSARVSNVTNLYGIAGGTILNFTMYVTDTSSNTKQNSTLLTITDAIKPIVNTTFNITNALVTSFVNYTANITDETGLLSANWTVNLSTGKIFANYTLSGTTAQVSNSTSLSSCTETCVLNFTIYATDTSNNVKQNSTLMTVNDVTPPIVNVSLNNTSPKKNEFINITSNMTDGNGLLSANITINFTTGIIKINYTLSGTSASIYNITQITDSRGNVLNITVYATDTSNNVKQNSTLITVADTLGSIFIGINNTSPKINEVINVSGNATDIDGDFGLGYISYNVSGNPQLNFSFSISGTKGNFSQNITINLTRGNVINFSVFYNDTAGTISQNSTLITVANTIPNGTNFVNTTGKHYNKNVSINWTPSNNPDNDILRYVVFSDTNNPPSALYYNGTDLNLSTNWTSDNTYFFQIKVMDEISESALSAVFNLTLDTGLPTLTNNCTNNTFTRLNLTCLFSIEDSFPYNLSVLVNRNGNDYHSKTNSTVIGRFINITFLLNLTEDGNYTIYVNASDSDKTSPKIDDKLTKQKQTEETHIYADIIKKFQMELKFKTTNLIEDDTPSPLSLKTFAEFNSKGTHLEFGVNLTADTEAKRLVFILQTTNASLSYINSTGFNNFVWNNYGIDFEGELKINNNKKDYGVKVKKVINQINKYRVIIIPNETINENDNITFISSSVFGLNTIDVFYNIANDQTIPNITNITPVNNTFASSAVNFTSNITETNPDKMELWINSTGTWHLNRTASYSNNITANFSLFNLSDGNYKWTVCANDTAGGRSCFAKNYTLTFDTIPPSITLNSPVNNTVISDGKKPNVNFRISSNEDVKNCSLFLSESLVDSKSTQNQSYTFSINSIDAGNYKWNATCYDLTNNLGASGIFNLEIKILSGGSGSISEPAGGGGIGTPSFQEEVETIKKGYTMTYICGKVKKFLNNTPNYDLSSIVLLQEDIRFEINFIIPFTTLKGYVDDYKQFCGDKKQETIIENKTQQPVAQSIGDRFSKIANFNWGTYIKLPFQADFGRLGSYGKNVLGLFDFVNVFLPLSVSDKLSDTPNVVWEGGIRVFPLIAIITIIIIIIAIIRIYHSNKKLDLLSSVDNTKKKDT